MTTPNGNEPALPRETGLTGDEPQLGGERKLFAMVLKYLQSYAVRGNEIDAEFLSTLWNRYDVQYIDGVGYFYNRQTRVLENVFDTYMNEFR